MSATIIEGKPIAARVRARVAEDVAELSRSTGVVPGLATVLVGDDPASAVYVGGKQRACAEVGMKAFDIRLPQSASHAQVSETLAQLNENPEVSGILLQLPVPEQLDGPSLTEQIDASKDVDGLTPVSVGRLSLGQQGMRPCTPIGVMELLASLRGPEGALIAEAETPDSSWLSGMNAVVVGRSNLFGKPMAALLLAANATVTVCHSRTRDLAATCAGADVLIVAAGRPRMIGAEHVRSGAVVIDVGVNRLTPEQAGNKSGLVGDVDFAAVSEIAAAITPVPGGVGPMTIAMLMRNTLDAARARHAQGR
ncbi:MAG TPA: bifunctional methylenetetrahydrofolate dehydrogenase/methenyltetrahydrofolate cyclohydrolase FolD [Solirubrobacteraceae bacterium]|jgi:methylenetetrahydrofolate dehydrogenase (NADP+)/methenyltetrahydrofolate cyclohydrolase